MRLGYELKGKRCSSFARRPIFNFLLRWPILAVTKKMSHNGPEVYKVVSLRPLHVVVDGNQYCTKIIKQKTPFGRIFQYVVIENCKVFLLVEDGGLQRNSPNKPSTNHFTIVSFFFSLCPPSRDYFTMLCVENYTIYESNTRNVPIRVLVPFFCNFVTVVCFIPLCLP